MHYGELLTYLWGFCSLLLFPVPPVFPVVKPRFLGFPSPSPLLVFFGQEGLKRFRHIGRVKFRQEAVGAHGKALGPV